MARGSLPKPCSMRASHIGAKGGTARCRILKLARPMTAFGGIRSAKSRTSGLASIFAPFSARSLEEASTWATPHRAAEWLRRRFPLPWPLASYASDRDGAKRGDQRDCRYRKFVAFCKRCGMGGAALRQGGRALPAARLSDKRGRCGVKLSPGGKRGRNRPASFPLFLWM